MADPVSLGVVATIVRTITSTIQNLYQLQQRYHAATSTLRNIICECEILELAVTQIQSWIECFEGNGSGAGQSSSNNADLQGLSRSLGRFLPTLQGLDSEVTRLLGGVGPGGRLGFRASVLYTWNEEVMKSHLDDIRWHANALHFLLTATSLSSQNSRSGNAANSAGGSGSNLASASRNGSASNASQNTDSNKVFEVSLSASEADLVTDEEIQMLLDISSGLQPPHQVVGADRLTAIQVAAKAGSLSTIQSILQQPLFRSRAIPTTLLLDPDNLDRNGRSALHYAAQSGNSDALKELLPIAVKDAQAAAGYADSDGLTLLHIAARYGHSAVAETLISLFGPLAPKKLALTSKSQGYTPFLEAVSSGRKDICHLLLHHGAKPSVRSKNNGTALHIAAAAGEGVVVPMLISCNIHLDWIDSSGETAIRVAAARGSLATVSALIDAGAKRNRKNNQGQTALHLAAENGHTAIVEILLRNGAKREITTNKDETAVELACSSMVSIDVVKLLGIASQKEGRSCLFRACRSRNRDIVAYLLSTPYVDVSARDPQDKRTAPTALHVASGAGDVCIAELLLKSGASVYLRDAGGNTPLHWAIFNRQWEVAKCLLKAGADFDTPNHQGKSPRTLAGMMEL
ncbi:hypothetical protein TWF281_007712 [Arthrobotrys megalospora]